MHTKSLFYDSVVSCHVLWWNTNVRAIYNYLKLLVQDADMDSRLVASQSLIIVFISLCSIGSTLNPYRSYSRRDYLSGSPVYKV